MYERILKLDQGKALIVSDLQGNLTDFERCLELFFELYRAKKCDYIVFCGDVIHGYAGYPDESLEIINKLIRLLQDYSNIILLMGNHELAHVMHWQLSKRNLSFTDDFEKKILFDRELYWNFFEKLPFAVVSKGGLFINHTGPSAALSELTDEKWDLYWKHHSKKDWYQHLDIETSFLITRALKTAWNPDFGKKLLELPQGQILWEVFMNKNEYQYKSNYDQLLKSFIKTMNLIAPVNLVISGHIPEEKGYRIVHEKHFRLCTSYGVVNQSNKRCLLVSLENAYEQAQQLEPCLIKLWN